MRIVVLGGGFSSVATVRHLERTFAQAVEEADGRRTVKGQASSLRLRKEIAVREQRLVELNQQIQHLRGAAPPACREIGRAWVEALVKKLTDLLRTAVKPRPQDFDTTL